MIAVNAGPRRLARRPASAKSNAGRAEASGTAHGLCRFADFRYLHLGYRCDDHLGDTHSAGNDEIVFAEIDQQHLHFTAVITVDRAGRVEAGDTVLEGEAGARTDLRLETCRDLENEAGRHQSAFARRQRQRFGLGHRSTQVHAGGTGGFVRWQVQAIAIRQADEIELGRR